MQRKNYADRSVSLGLGFIWLLWGGGLIILLVWLYANFSLEFLFSSNGWFYLSASLLGYAVAAGVVFAFGLIDDLAGTAASRGFRGHLKALAHGKITTGAVKLFGIGITALLFAYFLLPFSVGAVEIIAALLFGGAVALSANFVNLCDLRPGRATKVSILMLVIGLFIGVVSALIKGGGGIDSASLSTNLLNELAMFLVFLLPMLITLPYDLRERGMLGDAGANPSGFIAGAYLATRLGLIGLIIFFVVMLALNLASERFSFTRVIEKNPLLSRLDQIGRIRNGKTD